jgi:hypothetical protein
VATKVYAEGLSVAVAPNNTTPTKNTRRQSWRPSRNARTTCLREQYARALYADDAASHDDMIKAMAILEDVVTIRDRVFGTNHAFRRVDESPE